MRHFAPTKQSSLWLLAKILGAWTLVCWIATTLLLPMDGANARTEFVKAAWFGGFMALFLGSTHVLADTSLGWRRALRVRQAASSTLAGPMGAAVDAVEKALSKL